MTGAKKLMMEEIVDLMIGAKLNDGVVLIHILRIVLG